MIGEEEIKNCNKKLPDDGGNNWDQPLIIAEPDVQVITISETDQFVVLACDGLYDVFTNEEVVSFVLTQLSEHGDPQRCCQVRIRNWELESLFYYL